MRRILLALVLSLFGTPALAQGCGPQNPNCIVPTAPVGTSNNQAASTEFVHNEIGTNLPLANGNIFIGNVSNVATATPPSALTKTDDTNVTVTLGGSPATALVNPASITMGWVGTLAAGRLNANVVQSIVNDTNVTGAIATQTLTLGWAGTLSVARGGTGIGSGTSGGIPYFSGATTIASSGVLSANNPVIGGGAGVAPSSGTRSGNTTAFVTTTGAQTSGNCVSIDANGNHIASGGACGTSGTPASFSANKNGTDQTGVPDVTYTTVTFSTELYDNGNLFASNTWTPPSGVVNLTGQVVVTGTIAVGNSVAACIAKNGTCFKQNLVFATLANNGAALVTAQDQANGTDTYTLQVFVDTTSGTGTVSGNTLNTWFMGSQVR